VMLFLLFLSSLLFPASGVIHFGFNALTVWLYTDEIVRVTYTAPDSQTSPSDTSSLIVSYTGAPVAYELIRNPTNGNNYTIITKSLRITVLTDSNWIGFYENGNGNKLLLSEPFNETTYINGKTYTPETDPINGKETYQFSQTWQIPEQVRNDTTLYGFGEYQNGLSNYRDSPIRCLQYNTQACIPFLISNQYWGILWDNYAVNMWNKPDERIILNPHRLNGENGWLNYTALFTATRGKNTYNFWLELIGPYNWPYGNDYVRFTATSRKNGMVNQVLVDWEEQNNMGGEMLARIQLEANETVEFHLQINCPGTVSPSLFVRYPSDKLDIESLYADYIDYYFIYSPSNYNYNQTLLFNTRMDGVIQNYRLLTGEASMYPIWAYGFWQCRERYHNQSEILDAAAKFRQKQLPVDVIVQDWQYWGSLGWGPQWDPSIYPKPQDMVTELHAMNIKLMVSVWSKFANGTTFYDTMHSNNQLIPGQFNFDPYNPSAAVQFYKFVNDSMYSIGVDAIWLDATEPEQYPQINATLNMSQTTGRELANTYPLYVTRALSDNLHIDRPNKRVFHLSRSSFPGQQATGGAIWSGDSTSSNDVLRRQIAASLNYQLSGIPYWSQDIGGFFRPSDQYTDPWYQRLLTRWFQFGAFTPIFRVHGDESHTEYWNYGPNVLQDVLLIDNLRYRLLPYIYTLAYLTAVNGYTFQRHLILDYPKSPQVWDMADEFMFGPYLLVKPIWEDSNVTSVYLPGGNGETWWNFWSGVGYASDQYLQNQTFPLSQIPLYAKSGSILILGPFVQWSTQVPWYVLEIRIYQGMDGKFTLFEDDGLDRLSIQQKQYSTITFQWQNSAKILSISQRMGSFPGMITSVRQFNIVLVRDGHGVGVNDTPQPDKVVFYVGSAIQVDF